MKKRKKIKKDVAPVLKEHFRAVYVAKREVENGKMFAFCKCYLGSSKMNKEEMGQLIEATLDYAEQIGIDTSYYEDVLS